MDAQMEDHSASTVASSQDALDAHLSTLTSSLKDLFRAALATTSVLTKVHTAGQRVGADAVGAGIASAVASAFGGAQIDLQLLAPHPVAERQNQREAMAWNLRFLTVELGETGPAGENALRLLQELATHLKATAPAHENNTSPIPAPLPFRARPAKAVASLPAKRKAEMEIKTKGTTRRKNVQMVTTNQNFLSDSEEVVVDTFTSDESEENSPGPSSPRAPLSPVKSSYGLRGASSKAPRRKWTLESSDEEGDARAGDEYMDTS